MRPEITIKGNNGEVLDAEVISSTIIEDEGAPCAFKKGDIVTCTKNTSILTPTGRIVYSDQTVKEVGGKKIPCYNVQWHDGSYEQYRRDDNLRHATAGEVDLYSSYTYAELHLRDQFAMSIITKEAFRWGPSDKSFNSASYSEKALASAQQTYMVAEAMLEARKAKHYKEPREEPKT